MPVVTPFIPPQVLKGPPAAVKGQLASIQVRPPLTGGPAAPFFAPHQLLRGPVPARARTPLTGSAAPHPSVNPPPAYLPRWQGATHMIASTATGNLIQGSTHTGAGGPGDIKGDFEQNGN